MVTILKWCVAVFVLSQMIISTSDANLPDITPAELVEAIKSADSRLVNVETRYVVDQRFREARDTPPRGSKRKLEIHWRKEGIRECIDTTCHDYNLPGEPFRFVLSFNGKIRMQWQPNDNKGGIYKEPYTSAWPIPFDYGLTPEKRGEKMLGEVLEHCTIETLEEERWEDYDCYYIEAVQPDKARIKAWIDPNAGYRARRLKFWGHDGLIWYEASAEFKDCGNGIWFPVKGVFKLYGNDKSTEKRVVSMENRLKVEQVEVNADLKQKDFEIQFPHGTKVYVHSLKDSYIAGINSLGGFGEEALNLLTGKPLPGLKEFGTEYDPNQIKDKMTLLCFWDMNQRPSRRFINQLAGKAEQLNNKELAIIAVQASKVDGNKLNEWTKKNNIAFSVGVITQDFEKARLKWGVRSLPWLILTDKQHTVIAEGFNLNELDEKLSKTPNN